MSTVTVKDGTTIYYKDCGSGQPIVFSHGWPLSADDWDTQMLFFLNHGYRVIAHDRRGHGRSSQTGGGHDMDHYADDLAALTEHLNLKDAIHVGHSTGGGEVVRYLGRHGESRVAKAAILSAVPPLMVKTAANPNGLPKQVFDDLHAQLAASRSNFYYDYGESFFSILNSCSPARTGGRMASIVKKLGLKPGMRALVLGAPSVYMNSLSPLPDQVEVSLNLGGTHEFIQFFATKKSDIAKSTKKLLQSATPGALVWITYPKKTSGVDSDLSREAVWAAMEGTGWRPVSQIAIDEGWSALRLRPTEDVKSRKWKIARFPITRRTRANAPTIG